MGALGRNPNEPPLVTIAHPGRSVAKEVDLEARVIDLRGRFTYHKFTANFVALQEL